MDFCDVKDRCILIGQGGNFNVHIDENFTASKHMCVFTLKENNNSFLNYLYNVIRISENKFVSNGTTIQWINKKTIGNVEILIPKNKELINELDITFQEIISLKEDIKNCENNFKNLIQELNDDTK